MSSLPPNRRGLQRVVGRYAIFDEIASGGMATVHFGRLLGPVGFTRTVAIKRLHPQFAKDPEFVSMFLDEARLAARIRHMNVVPSLDVVAIDGELFLVMDYVQGESLSRLWRSAGADGNGGLMPQAVAVSILSGVLQGLHAAHEAKNERGEPLGIVHRDVSPHNVLVSTDGIARVLDFGIAKAAGRVQTTREGQIKGKIAYMAPEYLNAQPVDRRGDVYAVGVILWQCLTGRRLFEGDSEGMLLARVLESRPQPPSQVAPGVPPELDEVTLRALARNPADRFQTARAMAIALEQCVRPATPSEVGEWVESLAGASLHRRAERMAEIESLTATQVVPDNSPTRILDSHSLEGLGVPPLPVGPVLFEEAPSFAPAPVGLDQLAQFAPLHPPGPASSPALAGPPSGPTPSRPRSAPFEREEPSSPDASSQLSGLSVVSRMSAPPPGWDARQRRRKVALGVISVLGLASAGVLVAGLVGSTPSATRLDVASSQGLPPAPPERAHGDAPPAPDPAASSVDASTPGAPTPAPTPAAPPKATPKATHLAPPPPPPRPSPAAPARPRPAGDCSPPYTLDAQGIRRIKPQCL